MIVGIPYRRRKDAHVRELRKWSKRLRVSRTDSARVHLVNRPGAGSVQLVPERTQVSDFEYRVAGKLTLDVEVVSNQVRDHAATRFEELYGQRWILTHGNGAVACNQLIVAGLCDRRKSVPKEKGCGSTAVR